MAENRLKIRIRRMLRSPLLRSCKSKDLISDVVPTYHRRHHHLFSPAAAEDDQETTAKLLPFLSPDVNGRKCPPASPIFHDFPKHIINNKKAKAKAKTKTKTKKKANKKCAFEDRFPDCKYVNGLFFSSDDDDDDDRGEKLALSSTAAAAVGDSLAVVKRSSDPYNDFKTSMVEMIVEKHIFAARDLENLLRCFLSLNSYHHHKLIIQVFADISEAFFSCNHI